MSDSSLHNSDQPDDSAPRLTWRTGLIIGGIVGALVGALATIIIGVATRAVASPFGAPPTPDPDQAYADGFLSLLPEIETWKGLQADLTDSWTQPIPGAQGLCETYSGGELTTADLLMIPLDMVSYSCTNYEEARLRALDFMNPIIEPLSQISIHLVAEMGALAPVPQVQVYHSMAVECMSTEADRALVTRDWLSEITPRDVDYSSCDAFDMAFSGLTTFANQHHTSQP